MATVPWHRVVRALQLFLLAAALRGALAGRADLVLNAGVGLGFTVAPVLVERRIGGSVPPWLVAWLAGAASLHVAGMVLGLYWPPGWYDNLTHAASGSVVAAAGYVLVAAWDRRAPGVAVPGWFAVALVLAVVSAAGVTWEIVEFAVARGVQLGLADTVSDLAYNLLGGAVALGLRRHLEAAADDVAAGPQGRDRGEGATGRPEPSR